MVGETVKMDTNIQEKEMTKNKELINYAIDCKD